MKQMEWTKKDEELLRRACRSFCDLRQKSQKSLEELSDETQISLTMLHAIEQGLFEIVDLESFYKLCRYYYVLPRQLLTERDEKNNHFPLPGK